MGLTEYFRKKALRKYGSRTATSILSVAEVSTAIALIDVQDTSFNECKQGLMNFFRDNRIKGEIFFLDLRKIGKGERLITSVTNTILRRDLNWYGRPSAGKLALFDNIAQPDLFISLIDDGSFTAEFTARYCKARCKVGRTRLDGDVFDIVVSDPSDRRLSEAESLEAIKQILGKIQG